MSEQTQEQKDAVARAYAHMDEATEAHSRGEETEAEKALRDAREGRAQDPRQGTGVTLRQDANPKTVRKPAPRGLSADKAARVWRDRNREYRKRKRLTIGDPAEAIAIWRRVRAEGEIKGGTYPKGAPRPPAVPGDSIDRQVCNRVQRDADFLEAGESLEQRIEAWPLPCTFYAPVSPLCDAELHDLAEAEREKARKTPENPGRLLPGMVRQ